MIQASSQPFPDRRLRPADPWFAIEWLPGDILRLWEPHVCRLLRANMFLIWGRDRHLLVDAGMGVASLRAMLAPLIDRPITLLLTHAHVDHVGSAAEFAENIVMHFAEAHLLREAPDWSLTFDTSSEERKRALQASGFNAEGSLIAALPHAGFDPACWSIPPTRATGLVDEGDVLDLGGRAFTVLHLPGHTPGSIALLDEADGTLIGGDAIYDGLIIDTLPESDRAAYADTMRRLKTLDIRTVHGGHRESFGPEKLAAIIDAYLATTER